MTIKASIKEFCLAEYNPPHNSFAKLAKEVKKRFKREIHPDTIARWVRAQKQQGN